MLSVTIMVDDVEMGWLLGVLTLIASTTMHAFACPYLDAHIDECEQFALLGTVLTYLAGLVFTFEHASCDTESIDRKRDECLSKTLEYFAALVIIVTAALGIYTELRVMISVKHKTKVGVHAYLEESVTKLMDEHEVSNQKRIEQAHKQEARYLAELQEREGKGESAVETANPTFDAESPLADEKGEAKEKSDKQKANKQKAEKIMKNIREEYAEIKELGFKEDGRWKIAPR